MHGERQLHTHVGRHDINVVRTFVFAGTAIALHARLECFMALLVLQTAQAKPAIRRGFGYLSEVQNTMMMCAGLAHFAQ